MSDVGMLVPVDFSGVAVRRPGTKVIASIPICCPEQELRLAVVLVDGRRCAVSTCTKCGQLEKFELAE
jgi:hypothetical protein